MSAHDLDRPPDPDGPYGRWWEDVYTLGWAAQRQDAETLGLEQGATAVLDRLMGRCTAALHPPDRAAPAPESEQRRRILRRLRHLVQVSERLTGNTTVAEVRVLLETYGPLARADADADDPTVEQRLDELAGA